LKQAEGSQIILIPLVPPVAPNFAVGQASGQPVAPRDKRLKPCPPPPLPPSKSPKCPPYDPKCK
jgi:hypothetical protein